MTRLTNEMRDEFLHSVIGAMPWKNTMTDALAVAEAEKRAYELVPTEVKAMVKKYPGLMACKDGALKGFPERDPVEMAENLGKNVRTAYFSRRYFRVTIPNIVDVEKIKVDDLIKAVLKRDAESMERYELKLKLRGVTYHATTVEELQAALPDLKQWMPKPAPKHQKTMAVAPIGLVASLKKAGLPISKGAS